MVIGLAAAALVAVLATLVLSQLLNVGTDEVQPVDLTGTVLTIVAGVGGVVFLVVAYRKQRDVESSRFVEHFGAASEQLGHPDPAVRMAGVYAMAGVADQVLGLKRQQCIDVLCGYLRLPYSPEIGANHQHQVIVRRTPGDLRPEIEEHHSYRQNDRVVRQTIVGVIKDHLQWTAEISWSDWNFDCRGAVFEEADLRGAHFSGRTTSFKEAHFTGETTRFNGARFTGETTRFDGAHFTGSYTSFNGARFTGETTRFDGAHFVGETIRFDEARFTGTTDLRSVDFGAGTVNFGFPEQWNPPPEFDWDDDPAIKPANVEPAEWPSVVNDHE
ncbi:pentapeptide repeat-containing protein [Arthrobacter sp. CAN_C5]|uniref:pentapeptide repeat-containing protein n=1 Tax=Arthrobacter sp. CAN_C5 TaxID=2760706 RepID=UPI001AE224FD|nr:pentapeptide repeat-containing protein [Arthrobacter sp. CAN_C5]MBP2215995.1 hypothetical protein [Arthrobacter sp. CAN_C5]